MISKRLIEINSNFENKLNFIKIYDYNYNLTVFEERFNVITFMSGNAGLMYAR